MKKISIVIILFLVSAINLQAQNFDDAMALYNDEQFEEAANLFIDLEDDRSVLFAGKSFLSLGQNTAALGYLNQALTSELESIQHEALYSLSIAHFRLKNYSNSLDYLRTLLESNNRTGLRSDAQRLYTQQMNYLSMSERFETLRKVQSPAVRFDMVNSSKTYTDFNTYSILLSEFLKTVPDSTQKTRYLQQLEIDTRLRQFFNQYPTAPQGTVYNIGVILPTFDENDPDFTIPRNIYYGMIIAAEEFNITNANRKVRLHFKNSAEDADTTSAALTELVWANQIDAVVGPLFSEPAERMAQLAEEFRVPMIAPLANSDELNLDYNYTFQLNPTFEIHGKEMARFAVEELELDSIAIITDSKSLGRASALSFRHEAEKLGAHISYYFEDDLASVGYDLSAFTEVFTPDSTLIDSLGYTPSQAIYAPFTGQAATTLSNLLLNDLEAMRSDLIILGSEEWANADMSAYQRRIFEIYYTKALGQAADSSAVEFFQQDFETRFGFSPDNFASIGYDAANYLFQSLETAGNPIYLDRVLKTRSPYNGLSLKIDFDGNRVNQHLNVHPLTGKAEEKMEEMELTNAYD